MKILKRDMNLSDHNIRSWSFGIVSLLLLGAIEMSWITIYRLLPAGDATIVARGVSEALLPNTLSPAVAVPFGVAIELGLAVMAGIAIACIVRAFLVKEASRALEIIAIFGFLAGIWMVNFLIILSEINPAFIGPFSNFESIFYNIIFGSSAALILRFHDGFRVTISRDETTVNYEKY